VAGKQSAGLILFRRHQGAWQVFLVHPGGPYWKGKDRRAWSIPKGEFELGEDPLQAAKRERRSTARNYIAAISRPQSSRPGSAGVIVGLIRHL
jgi:predicted NUDIX family NTP pyrophosphohydrolase